MATSVGQRIQAASGPRPNMNITGEGPVQQQGLAGAGNIMAQARQGFAQAQGMPAQQPNQMPAGTPPPQGMAMAPQQGAGQQPFNIQQAVAQGLQAAGLGTAANLGFQPQQITPTSFQAAQTGQVAPLQAQQVQAGQLGTTSLSPYMNPYESQVVGQTLSDLERSRQMQQNLLGAQATAAGAFGGSRQGIAEAETNRAFAEQAARTAGQLRQAGFGQAQQAAQQDIASRMQAALANQQAGLQAGMTSAQLQQQANLANQQAMQQAGMFGAEAGMEAQRLNQLAGLQGAQQRLGAAGQLADIANLGFGIGRQANLDLAQQGMMQQMMQQALIDAGKQQYAGFQGAPQQALNQQISALQGANLGQQTQTGTFNPGLFNYLQLGASIFGGGNTSFPQYAGKSLGGSGAKVG